MTYWPFINITDDVGPLSLDPAAMSILPMHQLTVFGIVTSVFVFISKVMSCKVGRELFRHSITEGKGVAAK